MVKNRLQEIKSEKKCFGTKEWSRNSGICNSCELKDACKEAKEKKGSC